MRLDFLVEGPLLRFVFAVFFVGVATRFAFFLTAIVASAKNRGFGLKYVLVSLGRFLFPFHMAVKKRPVYAVLRYVFHICLFAVPIFLFGHIVLWEESRFEWSWSGLPDQWADAMTIVAIALAVFFFLRRILFKDARSGSSILDYFIIKM